MLHQILKNIRAIRKQKGLSQEFMAEQLGATQSSYARFENQIRKIDFELVEQIAGIFNMTLVELISHHAIDRPGSTSNPASLKENSEDLQRKENKLLKERIIHLEQVVRMKDQQLHDKDLIIDLLKNKNLG